MKFPGAVAVERELCELEVRLMALAPALELDTKAAPMSAGLALRLVRAALEGLRSPDFQNFRRVLDALQGRDST